MKDLFKDITIGLTTQGWKDAGGNDDTFLILNKPGKTIKVFADNYEEPRHFIVRYSYNEKEEKKIFNQPSARSKPQIIGIGLIEKKAKLVYCKNCRNFIPEGCGVMTEPCKIHPFYNRNKKNDCKDYRIWWKFWIN
jgi:hypothetical protein